METSLHLKQTVTTCVLVMMAVSTVFMNQSIFLELSKYFNVNMAHARLSFSLVSLSYSLAFLLAGPYMDRGNLPRIAFWGTLSLAVSLLVTSFAPNYHLFLACMLPMGICAALVPASMFPYVSLTAPKKNKGVYVGSIVAAGTLGVIWGRVTAGILTSWMGWKGAYQMIALLAFICAAAAQITLTGFTVKRPYGTPRMAMIYKNAYQLVFQWRTMALMLMGGTLFFGFLGVITFLSYRLNRPPFNFSAGQIGWLSFAGITALVSPFAGHLSSRMNIKKMVLTGIVSSFAACLLLGWATTVSMIIAGLLLLFLSVYTCQPLIFMMVGQCVPAQSLGSASSLYIFFCIGGGSLSSMILGPVWTQFGWPGIIAVCSLSIITSFALILAVKNKGI